ncbi:endosialidase-like protein [Azorhizobium sp. AG788]|uniref:tail fiber domain-containing protein n=1 Tax=Azorhizobium sp. AG788 TaxID=2183897 RepID=UPI0010610998|nr:tail fiber domain-containing protein [Azorhizobium sp. AG788]TDT94556.1 endosialidase-like protein [Azorhizobium sp. AG788]
MPQIDRYISGTVSVTSGSGTINGTSTAWADASMTKFSVLAGHFIRIGNYVGLIVAVNSPTQVVAVPPYGGATANGLSYEVYRTTWIETAAIVGYLQAVANRGLAAAPMIGLYLDNSVMRMALRDDGAGNPSLFVGGTGAADAAMPRVFSVDKTTGNFWTTNGSLGVGTSGGIISYRADVRGTIATTAIWFQKADGTQYTNGWIGGFPGLDGNSAHNFLHVGGVTSADGVRRISLQGDLVSVAGKLGVGEINPQAAIHSTPVGGACPLRLEVNATNPPIMQLYRSNGAADQKFWDWNISADGAILTLRALTDTYASPGVVMDITRVGASVTGIFAGATLYPNVDGGARNLGGASLRWGTVYAITAAINTSDIRFKLVRGAFTDQELDAWGDVRASAYQFLDAIAEKGAAAARMHSGWIAQEVEAAFTARGLDARRYALFCADTVTEKVKVTEKRERPAVDIIEQVEEVVHIIGGVPTLVEEVRQVSIPRQTIEPVVRADGTPVMVFRPDPKGEETVAGEKGRMEPMTHAIPVMEEYDAEVEIDGDTSERLGLRYEEALVLETAWLRRELARQAARITALEARAAA